MQFCMKSLEIDESPFPMMLKWSSIREEKAKIPLLLFVSKTLRRGAIKLILKESAYPKGEDEVSFKRHNDFIKNEVSRRSPGLDKIKRRMEHTFPERRRYMNNVLDLKKDQSRVSCTVEFWIEMVRFTNNGSVVRDMIIFPITD